MIYEAAVVAYSDLDETRLEAIRKVFREVVTTVEGKILVEDDWGVRLFGQSTEKGINRGHYLYFMYKASSGANQEIDRRLRINENVIKSLCVSLGGDRDEAKIVKNHRNPFLGQ